MTAQVAGVIVAAVGGLYLWSPWALVIAGAVLILLPELAEMRRR